MNIYSQISANRTKTWLLMVLFIIVVTVFIQAIGFYMGLGYEAGIAALVLTTLVAVIGYYSSSSMVLGISHAKEVKHDEYPDLYHIVENLCIGSGLPMPKIYIIDDTAPNAFATGRDPQHASVAVTKGLLTKLDKLELEGVIAHELSHIKNLDIRLMAVTVVLVGFVALLADIFLRYAFFTGGGRSSGRRGGSGGGAGVILLVLALVMAILAPISAKLIQLAVSRRRESMADASSALLTRYPEGLARALEKISSDTEPLEVANKATAHLYIVNPLKDHVSWINHLFDTHPPIQERVKALRAM
jgi:heat shock protein HtpX